MIRRTSKRPWQTGPVLLIAGALILAACGRSEETTGASDAASLDDAPASGSLTIWAQGTEGEALPELVEQFEAENPDVKIDVTAVPWDSAQNKYQTAIAGGNTPDIGMLGVDWIPTFVDALEPTPEDIDLDGMFPGAVESTQFDGTTYTVPWYVETRVVFYRTDLMREAGFDEFPDDWEGFKALAAAYQDNGARYGVGLPSGGWNAFLGGMPFAWSNGAELMTDDGSEWTIDTPEILEAVEYLKTFFDEGIATKNPDSTSGPAADLVSGDVPMMISGPWDVGQIMAAGGEGFEDQFAVARIPGVTSSTSLIAGANLAVFEGSENVESAWKLIRWLSEPEVQQEWFELTGDLPSQIEAWDTPALSENPLVAVFGEQLDDVRSLPMATTWPELSAAADTAVEQIYRGGKDAALALEELQASADSLGTGR
ncbi:sugar ABC transporter substrate-binding protein [Phytoactinopolyspora mesophila]|uniref:Extracellular solute-binding protein n=1 Tax=Phytoactinopolyspora mesophila TaxID=2650750 RepID=A0A7K3M812_9ACTN|nr:sugar ABC transporter substrate-binding protein [Phytoactinopolyspora mesophila]NDL59436.1 extracellular solute-binding protein [Phytoactinopolyspora mesophila]